ncbi:MAG: 50S ribosomal protein L31 [Nitrospiria bacterium]
MKEGIHPKTYDIEITCATCGSALPTRSTVPSIRLEVCGSCHPFYTGTQRIVDTEGRVERFKKKYQNAGKK